MRSFKTDLMIFKDAVKSLLRIGSSQNKAGLADINFAQISYLGNLF